MQIIRSSSDLLSNIRSVPSIVNIECLTLDDNNQTHHHMINTQIGVMETDNPEIADPVLCAIVTMLHHQ